MHPELAPILFGDKLLSYGEFRDIVVTYEKFNKLPPPVIDSRQEQYTEYKTKYILSRMTDIKIEISEALKKDKRYARWASLYKRFGKPTKDMEDVAEYIKLTAIFKRLKML